MIMWWGVWITGIATTPLPPVSWRWLGQEAWLSGAWMARDRIMEWSE